MGGMTAGGAERLGQARRSRRAAAEKQARIDSRRGRDRRRQQVPARRRGRRSTIRDIDNHAVREKQVARLAGGPRAAATARPCRRRSTRLPQCAKSRRRQPARPAASKRPAPARTLGEISDALETAWAATAPSRERLRRLCRGLRRATARLARAAGAHRRLRRRRRAAARACSSPRWARTGTTAAPRSSPPPSPIWALTSTWAAVRDRRGVRAPGVELKVDAVGVSSLAAGHKTLVPAIDRGAARRRAPATSPSSSAASSRAQDYAFLSTPASRASTDRARRSRRARKTSSSRSSDH